MREIREKTGLKFRNTPQIISILIQFRIESDHSAIRVLEFTIELRQLVLFFSQLGKSLQQLLILAFHFVERIGCISCCQIARDPSYAIRIYQGCRLRQQLGGLHSRPFA